MSRRKLAALACALMAAVATMGAGAASAAPAEIQGLPTFLGVKAVDEGDNGQCVGAKDGSWTTNPNSTNPIRLDTDNRPGGCQLSFGIGDIDGSLAGLNVTYKLKPHPGAHEGQCGENWEENPVPIGSSFSFGKEVRVDSDSRGGWCDLTFKVSGRNDVMLEVLFKAENGSGQCINSSDQWQPVVAGLSLTLGIDTDGRPGGCGLALRLQKF